jgi:putative tricarboxylic transport membrane protein
MTNIIAAVLMLVAMAVATLSMAGDAYWTEFAPGPAFMPYWVAGLGALTACLLLVQSLRKGRSAPDETDFSDVKQAGFVILLLCALLFLLPWLGMLIGSTIMILIILIGMQRRPVAPSLLTAAITALLVYGVFQSWLGVDLPKSVAGF